MDTCNACVRRTSENQSNDAHTHDKSRVEAHALAQFV